jgi:hypothetical protein
MSAMPDDATELRMTASEARSDAKLAQLRSDSDQKFAQLRSDSDQKFAQLRSDSDLRFAQVLGGIETMKAELGGKLDTLGARVDGLHHRLSLVEGYAAGMKFWVIGTGVAVLGLTVAIPAFGNDRLSLGAELSTIAEEAARRAVESMLPASPPEAGAPVGAGAAEAAEPVPQVTP